MDHPSTSLEKGFDSQVQKADYGVTDHIDNIPVGRDDLADALPPHESYEGHHRWDPSATWTPEEERRIVRKTDLYLLSWLCVMVWSA